MIQRETTGRFVLIHPIHRQIRESSPEIGRIETPGRGLLDVARRIDATATIHRKSPT